MREYTQIGFFSGALHVNASFCGPSCHADLSQCFCLLSCLGKFCVKPSKSTLMDGGREY